MSSLSRLKASPSLLIRALVALGAAAGVVAAVASFAAGRPALGADVAEELVALVVVGAAAGGVGIGPPRRRRGRRRRRGEFRGGTSGARSGRRRRAGGARDRRRAGAAVRHRPPRKRLYLLHPRRDGVRHARPWLAVRRHRRPGGDARGRRGVAPAAARRRTRECGAAHGGGSRGGARVRTARGGDGGRGPRGGKPPPARDLPGAASPGRKRDVLRGTRAGTLARLGRSPNDGALGGGGVRLLRRPGARLARAAARRRRQRRVRGGRRGARGRHGGDALGRKSTSLK